MPCWQVCKHPISFTPVFAPDAPASLPLSELLLGLGKSALRGCRSAVRVRPAWTFPLGAGSVQVQAWLATLLRPQWCLLAEAAPQVYIVSVVWLNSAPISGRLHFWTYHPG